MKYLLIFTLLFGMSCATQKADPQNTLSGLDHNNKAVSINTNNKKATVVVFLSSICPCSKSHTSLLRIMNKSFKDVQFIGIHSNQNEDGERSKSYFSNAKLDFPVIYDKDLKFAKRFNAQKTPQIFILNNSGTTIYTGPVTNKSNASKADENYLQQSLEQIVAGKEVSISERKLLGCNIVK